MFMILYLIIDSLVCFIAQIHRELELCWKFCSGSWDYLQYRWNNRFEYAFLCCIFVYLGSMHVWYLYERIGSLWVFSILLSVLLLIIWCDLSSFFNKRLIIMNYSYLSGIHSKIKLFTVDMSVSCCLEMNFDIIKGVITSIRYTIVGFERY